MSQKGTLEEAALGNIFTLVSKAIEDLDKEVRKGKRMRTEKLDRIRDYLSPITAPNLCEEMKWRALKECFWRKKYSASKNQKNHARIVLTI